MEFYGKMCAEMNEICLFLVWQINNKKRSIKIWKSVDNKIECNIELCAIINTTQLLFAELIDNQFRDRVEGRPRESGMCEL